MMHYFNELVHVDDVFDQPTSKPLKKDVLETNEEFNADHVMSFYYKETILDPRPRLVQTHIIQSVEEMAKFQEFRFQAVMLSLPEVKLLADLVISKESQFRKLLLLNIINFAKKVKDSGDSEHLFDRPQDGIKYLLFIEEHLPDGMESSYIARLHRSHTVLPKTDDFKQRRILSKVKEAIRNLLFSLDSFAMFFESKDDSSLAQIVDFVLKFSYLFESRKSSIQEKVPLKILAQYLHTHLEQVPEDFQINNFRKLYYELISEYELRYEQKREVASQNKQLLLICESYTAINSMEKHISDIKQEEKNQQNSQRSKRFLSFVGEIEIAVCISPDHVGKLTVYHQKECPHTKLEYIGNFVMGSKHASASYIQRNARRSFKAPVRYFPGHAQSIEEFAEEFCKFDSVKLSVEQEEDPASVGEAFFSYLRIVKNSIASNLLYSGRAQDEIEEMLEEVEVFIMRKMYREVFPQTCTEPDLKLHLRTKSLEWVQPENLDIPPVNRNEVMWTYAIKALKEADDCTSPAEKLTCLVECITIISNVLELCGNTGSGASSDDSLPIIIYVVIKAQPLRMYSNLNYITRFRDHEKMLGQSGFCFAQIQLAINFIETVSAKKLSITEEEFAEKMR